MLFWKANTCEHNGDNSSIYLVDYRIQGINT